MGYWGQFDELLGSYQYEGTAEGGFHMSSLTFTGNPGYLKPIEIDTTLDGVRATTNTTTGTFTYVSQCSNRGLCNGDDALCECFKGYTNDNCDTQSSLAV